MPWYKFVDGLERVVFVKRTSFLFRPSFGCLPGVEQPNVLPKLKDYGVWLASGSPPVLVENLKNNDEHQPPFLPGRSIKCEAKSALSAGTVLPQSWTELAIAL